ncbi:helix-turn-helix domain protein [Desulfotomaculum nigrificans CO-1-SRB]|uniref:Helix-turn-helix domain protein n=1 Tax=Desulfotomaculum nigrificans (strain DSM 14880 / VKM B-2319 / CO-1-SRB) TaxID=868595 RepID=F6B734_DESCC|nr:helix-turn-helix transcriptional regulator [Desulfotomaculum nigrificans]AEF94459.1 helix-turn-helix domain protein [Desulfotomaculum nigrificans CO-1-SRB]
MENKVEIDNKTIGQRIREEREKLGLSREEFAEIIGLSNYYVGQLERGERQMSLPVLVKIVNCLHVSLDYLIFGKDYQNAGNVNESQIVYEACNYNKVKEINNLLSKCSPKELELFKKLIKTILPYMSKKLRV